MLYIKYYTIVLLFLNFNNYVNLLYYQYLLIIYYYQTHRQYHLLSNPHLIHQLYPLNLLSAIFSLTVPIFHLEYKELIYNRERYQEDWTTAKSNYIGYGWVDNRLNLLLISRFYILTHSSSDSFLLNAGIGVYSISLPSASSRVLTATV